MYNKPIIIAICGKSATGKDTLARALCHTFKKTPFLTNLIINDTTRPSRPQEQDGVDYYFIDEVKFFSKINRRKYLTYTSFNDWYYGTDYGAIIPCAINIGVFNANAIRSLLLHQKEYEIICIYLTCNVFTRIKRSIQREKRIKFEYLRRVFADNKDFRHFKDLIKNFSNYCIIDTNNMNINYTMVTIYSQIRKNIESQKTIIHYL